MAKSLKAMQYQDGENVLDTRLILRGIPYTIEPGNPECDRFFQRKKYGNRGLNRRGGIVQCDKYSRLHDYEPDGYPKLSDFLQLFAYADGKLPSYFSKDYDLIRDYFVFFMRSYEVEGADQIIQGLDEYIHQNWRELDEDYFGPNIPIYSDFFKWGFDAVTKGALPSFFSGDQIDKIICDRYFYPSAPPKYAPFYTKGSHADINKLWPDDIFTIKSIFMDVSRTVFSVQDGEVFHCLNKLPQLEWEYSVFADDEINTESHTDHDLSLSYRQIICNVDDYETSIKPFCLFLSDLVLVTASYMALSRFGQCHFTIGWEDSKTYKDLERSKWPHVGTDEN